MNGALDRFVARARDGYVAPYAFVTVPDRVMPSPVYEAGAKTGGFHVSRPLPESLSGKLVVRWTAETPILVGGTDNETFFHWDGRPTIPGSSVRGLLRAALEILSFARLSFVHENQWYAVRDFQSSTWKKFAQGVRRADEPMTQGAWLCPVTSGPRKGSFDLATVETVPIPIESVAKQVKMSAKDWNEASFFAKRDALKANGIDGVHDLGRYDARLRGRRGTIVHTGPLPGGVVHGTQRARQKEVLFLEPDSGADIETVRVDPRVMTQFESSQPPDASVGTGKPETIWAYWHRHLFELKLRAPVFLRGDPAAAADPKGAPAGFFMSFSRFFRVPYPDSVGDVLGRTHPRSGALDFCQALFGFLPNTPPLTGTAETERAGDLPLPSDRKDSDRAWASRVFVFHASLLDRPGAARELWETRAVTLGPRPSFFPFYLRHADADRQPDRAVDHPLDYSSGEARLAGRKRYPARGGARPNLLRGEPAAKKEAEAAGGTESTMTFLDGTPEAPLVFEGRIRFRNLLPAELGGLVWAITLGDFGRDDSRHRHMLGRAKAFGYGQVRAEIDRERSRTARDDRTPAPGLAECVGRFEKAVEKWHADGTAYRALAPVAELLALTDPAVGARIDAALAGTRAGGMFYPTREGDDPLIEGYKVIRDRAIRQGRSAATAYALPRYPREGPD